MKRNLSLNDKESNKRQHVETNTFFGVLQLHEKLLREQGQISPKIQETIELLKKTYGDCQNEKESALDQSKIFEKIIETVRKLSGERNVIKLLDDFCLKEIFYFLPDFNNEETSKKLTACISFSRTCKQFYQISKEIQFQITILEKPRIIPFPVFQHLLQIPESCWTGDVSAGLLSCCIRKKLPNIIIPTLIQFGFDIDDKDEHGRSVISRIISSYHTVEQLQTLISYGVDFNAIDKEGRNCLHVAAFCCRKNTVEHLISIGMDPNQKTYAGENCLFLVSKQNNVEMVKYFVETQHMDPNEKNNKGENCLQAATKGPDLVLAQRATPIYPEIYKPSRKLELIKYLISLGMDPAITNQDGDTCLIHACRCNGLEVVKYLSLCIDVNAKNNAGNTCLFVALQNNSKKIVKYLLTLSIDWWIINNSNDSIWDWANEHRINIFEMLKQIHK